MIAAARWLFAVRRREEGQDSGTGSRVEPCPTCEGHRGQACGECQGIGWIDLDDRDLTAGAGPAAELSGFLEAYAFVERYGVDGAMRLLGVDEFDGHFIDALSGFASELARLEIEAAKARAEKAQAKG